jgi:3-hydroxy acid dehydrogenase/malonic semialdehyde reductase
MYSLKNKIVFITGASSGIGKACAEQYAAAGARVIITARRLERIQALAHSLQTAHQAEVLPLPLDVRDNAQVIALIKNLPQEWQQIDILVNNAGLGLTMNTIQEGDPAQWDTMIDTNIKGLLYVTHAILPTMITRNQGHIVNISSVAGHQYYPRGNIYSATKHAVKAISKSLRLDLLGRAIRVSDIAPGMVETEFSEVRLGNKESAKQVYANMQPLSGDDIADIVLYCTTRKPHVNIEEILVFPTMQASANHVHRTV